MRRLLLSLLFFVPAISSAQVGDLIIVIDPGHGGYESDDRHLIPDPGIDFWESESNYYKARHLQRLLTMYVDTVILTREENSDEIGDPSLQQRYELANSVQADWFHSIHSNATGWATNTTVNYTLVLLKEDKTSRQPVFPEAVTMSSLIYNQIRAHIRTQASAGNIPGYPGVYKDYTFYGGTNGGFNLGVLNGLIMPGELSEGSFHDNFPETRRLMNNDYRKMEAYGLMKAILEYFGVPADTMGIVAGIQTNGETGKPMNGTVVRILPENRVYSGDSFNNGFYMFDSLTSGSHKVVFETPSFMADTVEVVVATGGIHFVDRTLTYLFPTALQVTPANGDTAFPAGGPMSFQFSLPMDTASVRQGFSITPAANPVFNWSQDRKQLSVTFDPILQYLTHYTAKIDSNAKGSNGYRLDLNGDAVGGDTLSISFKTETALQAVASLSFGQIRKDDTAGVMLVIRNRASYDIVIASISHSTPQFWASTTLPDTVAAMDSTTFEVSFNPTAYGSFSDIVVFSADSGTIRVSVSGSSLAPNLIPSHSFQGFATVTTDTFKNRPFWLRTTSVNDVWIDSMFTKTASFSYSPQLSFPAGIGLTDTLFLTITFAPKTVGTISDTLYIYNNTSVNPIRIFLSGNGIINSLELLDGVVDHFALNQNYPNPFNPETVISYQLPASTGTVFSDVRVSVFDVLGREVAVLVNEAQAAGQYSVTWNAASFPSGVYFYSLATPQFRASKKMVLAR